MCVCVCARLKVCRHRHNLKPTKASHLHLLPLLLLLLQQRAAIIVISKAATAFPAFVMAAVELAIGGGGDRGVQTGCRHVPAVFHCCYFYLHTQLFSRCASSFKDSNATAAAATIINNVIIIIIVSVIIIGSNNNVCIVDINGTNRRPASLHKRKCRVVSVSLAVGERGRGEESKQATGYISDRRTNDHNCNG